MTAPPYIFSSLPTVVAVAPTTTILALIDARQYDYMSVQIENLDLTSTQSQPHQLQRRAAYRSAYRATRLRQASGVVPLTSWPTSVVRLYLLSRAASFT